MGIYLYNMEMPTSCGECKFFAWKRGVGQHCAVDDRITFHATLDGFDVGYERNGNCPLVPVPPHGRLIDADALIDAIIAKYIRHERNGELVFAAAEIKQDLVDIINELPTIIEAEEGET